MATTYSAFGIQNMTEQKQSAVARLRQHIETRVQQLYIGFQARAFNKDMQRSRKRQ